MDKDNDFDLQQLKVKSSVDLIQKCRIKVENEKASKRRKGSNSNQQHIGSTQQHPIFLSQTIGIDEGRIQKGLGKSTNTTQSLTIGGVPIPVRGSTGSIEAQNKRQEQMKSSSSLNIKAATQTIKTTQVSHQKDLAKSTNRAQSSTNERVSIQVIGSKKMQDKMLDSMKPSLNNKVATNIVQSELPTKRQLRSTAGGNQSQEAMVEEQSLKKKKYIPKCPSMPLSEFIEKNQQPHQEEELEEEEESDQEQGIEGDINYGSEEVGEFNENTTSKRTRGKTLCAKIHTRSANDREEIILNEVGQPIGSNARIVSQFSNFLGTIARSSDLCPLIYTNWKSVPEKDKNIWAYINEKYKVPKDGKKVVYTIIDEAWRRHKCTIKKNHFTKYKTLRERLKNRPDDIPEEHFKALMEYWSLKPVQEIS